MVDRQRVLAGKAEGLYNGNELGMFKQEGKRAVNRGGRLKGPSKLMGRGMNWVIQCGEEEDLAVGELDR